MNPGTDSTVRVERPIVQALPIVVDSPHSGTDYPADFGASTPHAQLRSSEDTWVDPDPFKGVEIIRSAGQPARGWHSMQIEVKRSLYMDADYQPNTGFERVQAAATAVLKALAEHAERARSARR